MEELLHPTVLYGCNNIPPFYVDVITYSCQISNVTLTNLVNKTAPDIKLIGVNHYIPSIVWLQ